VRDQQVSVNLKETVSQVVTVDGEVKEPGLYPVIGRMTLERAIARAKGLAEFGNSKNVVVFRTSKGQRYVALYNLEAIRRGSYEDPEVFANDLVVVGDSQARRFFKNILPFAATLTYVLVQKL
jgi:polysaccharide export outer membrane protein